MATTRNKYKHSTGIMNKMRDRMPLIIIILIIAFLATIVFEWGMEYMGMNQGGYVFAKVNGEEISAQEFEMNVQQRLDMMRQNNPTAEIDEAQITQVRQSVWDEMVQNILLDQEMDKMGISVSDQEVLDWIYKRPETLPQNIRQYFMDSLGVFNYEVYQNALQSKEPQVVEFWSQVEQGLRRTLLLQKLQNVITSSILVTEQEVLQTYKDQNIKASFEYLLLPLSNVTDPALNTVTDEEMRQYYEAHKSDYYQQESVRFDYIIVPEVASAEDTTNTVNTIKAYIDEFKTLQPYDSATNADSSLIVFVNENSQTPFVGDWQKPNAIQSGAMNFLMNAQPGQVSDVIMDEDGVKIVKMINSRDGEETYVKASHILINITGDTAAAKTKAEEIYNKAKSGSDFGELAFQLSEDPSAKTNRGNLGWFTKGAMVKEFEEAAFNGNTGDIIGPIKTQFGYHIIKVDGKTNKEFKFAEIKQPVVPGLTTKELIRIKAEEIYKQINEDGKTMDTVAYDYKITTQNTGDVFRNGQIPFAPGNQSLIKFGFDNEPGEMPTPVKVQGGFAVMQITEKIPEGYKNFDEIKETLIKPRVITDKKLNYLKSKADAIAPQVQSGNFQTFAEGNNEVQYDKIDSMTYASPSPNIGMDYNLMNTVFNMTTGQVSAPVKGLKGYYIVKLTEITPFNQQDYIAQSPAIRTQLYQQKQQQVVQKWLQDLKERADIEDNRDLFI
jgi:peptidyl-prolyl cis-trans isomerase D